MILMTEVIEMVLPGFMTAVLFLTLALVLDGIVGMVSRSYCMIL